jgi:hypothetical protein
MSLLYILAFLLLLTTPSYARLSQEEPEEPVEEPEEPVEEPEEPVEEPEEPVEEPEEPVEEPEEPVEEPEEPVEEPEEPAPVEEPEEPAPEEPEEPAPEEPVEEPVEEPEEPVEEPVEEPEEPVEEPEEPVEEPVEEPEEPVEEPEEPVEEPVEEPEEPVEEPEEPVEEPATNAPTESPTNAPVTNAPVTNAPVTAPSVAAETESRALFYSCRSTANAYCAGVSASAKLSILGGPGVIDVSGCNCTSLSCSYTNQTTFKSVKFTIRWKCRDGFKRDVQVTDQTKAGCNAAAAAGIASVANTQIVGTFYRPQDFTLSGWTTASYQGFGLASSSSTLFGGLFLSFVSILLAFL